ncbi:hypothetical protein OG225_16675 [Nocardia sp. NBC_01377]
MGQFLPSRSIAVQEASAPTSASTPSHVTLLASAPAVDTKNERTLSATSSPLILSGPNKPHPDAANTTRTANHLRIEEDYVAARSVQNQLFVGILTETHTTDSKV